MKLFLKISLYVFMAFIANVDVASASIPLPNNQETTALSFYGKALKTVVGVTENDLENYCQNGNDLINYRDWAISIIGVAAKTSTKMISQFSSSTIDDAVAYAMKNKVTHVFGKAAHNLDPLVAKLGGQENTFRAVLNAANGKLPSSGVFNNIPVNVGGYNVMIRGSVVNGVPKIGTMFIP